MRMDRIYGSSMAEVNTIAQNLTKNDNIEALVYLDNIGAAGSRTTINELGKYLRQMEGEMGVTFHVEKTNSMLLAKQRTKLKWTFS